MDGIVTLQITQDGILTIDDWRGIRTHILVTLKEKPKTLLTVIREIRKHHREYKNIKTNIWTLEIATMIKEKLIEIHE